MYSGKDGISVRMNKKGIEVSHSRGNLTMHFERSETLSISYIVFLKCDDFTKAPFLPKDSIPHYTLPDTGVEGRGAGGGLRSVDRIKLFLPSQAV